MTEEDLEITECCLHCKFFYPETIKYGKCRRFPPQVFFDDSEHRGFTFTILPEVYNVEWCGEFRQQGEQ